MLRTSIIRMSPSPLRWGPTSFLSTRHPVPPSRRTGDDQRILGGETFQRASLAPVEPARLPLQHAGGDVEWARSFHVGSGLLADVYLHGDPPTSEQLERVRDRAWRDARAVG